jgi:hypothetical protein
MNDYCLKGRPSAVLGEEEQTGPAQQHVATPMQHGTDDLFRDAKGLVANEAGNEAAVLIVDMFSVKEAAPQFTRDVRTLLMALEHLKTRLRRLGSTLLPNKKKPKKNKDTPKNITPSFVVQTASSTFKTTRIAWPFRPDECIPSQVIRHLVAVTCTPKTDCPCQWLSAYNQG